jgi:hypothetical protein
MPPGVVPVHAPAETAAFFAAAFSVGGCMTGRLDSSPNCAFPHALNQQVPDRML